MKEKICRLLKQNFPDKDFMSSDRLIDEGIIDSLAAVIIVTALADELGIEIPYEEVNRDNLNSVDSIVKMAERLLSK